MKETSTLAKGAKRAEGGGSSVAPAEEKIIPEQRTESFGVGFAGVSVIRQAHVVCVSKKGGLRRGSSSFGARAFFTKKRRFS